MIITWGPRRLLMIANVRYTTTASALYRVSTTSHWRVNVVEKRNCLEIWRKADQANAVSLMGKVFTQSVKNWTSLLRLEKGKVLCAEIVNFR